MCLGMGIDMRISMCIDMCIGIGMCIGIDMCIGMCTRPSARPIGRLRLAGFDGPPLLNILSPNCLTQGRPTA